MANRRTRKQKQQAAKRKRTRRHSQPSLKNTASVTPSLQSKASPKTQDYSELLVVPAHYIYADITKTIVLSAIFLAVIVGLWYGLEIIKLPILFFSV